MTHRLVNRLGPFAISSAVTSAFFIGSIFTPWALPIAVLPLTVTLIGWFWPKSSDRSTQCDLEGESLQPARSEA